MEVKRAENEIVTIAREHEDEYVYKILFAAFTTLAMACLKRILATFFVEQWRARVFIVLNLVLLAIFITSIRSGSSENQENNDNSRMIKNQERKGRKECGLATQDEEGKKCQKLGQKTTRDARKMGQQHYKVDSEEAQNLSKEELNERAEAFIAMFRQHLVSDARKGKNQFLSRTKQTPMFNLQKGSKLTNSCVAYRHI